MFKSIEREILQRPVTAALRREFLQHDYERLHSFCLLIYATSIGIWFLFDLIVSFEGNQGFSIASVLFLVLLYALLGALQFIAEARHFYLLNLLFVACYCIGLRLVIAGIPQALQPAWLTLAGSTMLYGATVMPLNRPAMFAVTALVCSLLFPIPSTADGALHTTLILGYWLFIIGLTLYAYLHHSRAKLHNFAMAHLLLGQAYMDALTEIPNRRAFISRVEQLMRTAGEPPCFLAMIDIDDFKKVNDRFGHDIGDQVLKHVATQIRQVMADQQYARLGGEEFGIYLQGLSRQEAEGRVEALCRQVREAPSDHPVTISIGLAQIAPGDGLSQALIKADKALYVSKRNGKNRYTYAA